MFSNSVRLIAKLSQMLLNPPCSSLILARDKLISGQLVFKSLTALTYEIKLPINIIINPHCIPSRMTTGQLKETLLGKILVQLGLFGDGTSFGNLDVKTICDKLLNIYICHEMQ